MKSKNTYFNIIYNFSGLSHNVFKGIIRKGYKIPTPIQRKVCLLFICGLHTHKKHNIIVTPFHFLLFSAY